MKKSISGIAGLLACVALAGCNAGDKPVTAPEQGKPGVKGADPTPLQQKYMEEVRELKVKITDREMLGKSVESVKEKYGFEEPGTDPRSEANILAEAEKAMRLLQSQEAVRPLEKAANVSQAWKRVKQFDLYLRQSTLGYINVNAGSTIQVTAQAIGSCDPFVVLFYQKYLTTDWHSHTIADYDDDGGGGLNSNAVWTNNTGTSQQVVYIVFSPNGYAGIGRANVDVRINGSSQGMYWNAPVFAAGPAFNNVGTCNRADRSQIQTTPINAPIFAMDAQRMRAFFSTVHSTSTTGGWIPANSYPNFVINFQPTSNPQTVYTMQQWDDCY